MTDLIAEYDAASDDPLRAHVYKAAHHGSQHFTVEFCRAVAADAAVVMSGDNKYDQHGHPRAVLIGTITRYSRCQKPAVFCTELAACYRKLPSREVRAFRNLSRPLYERAIQGIIHLRSNGRELYLGTVHGRRPLDQDRLANINWKWDVWP